MAEARIIAAAHAVAGEAAFRGIVPALSSTHLSTMSLPWPGSSGVVPTVSSLSTPPSTEASPASGAIVKFGHPRPGLHILAARTSAGPRDPSGHVQAIDRTRNEATQPSSQPSSRS